MSFGTTGSAPRRDDACPCGSGATYGGCCAPLLAGDPAPTPERLMRSRFTAFRSGDAAYLERTWHPRTRPASVELDGALEWTRLEIVDAPAATESDGAVEFRAFWRNGAERGVLHERSRFARRAGRWLYVDGDMSAE